MAFHRQISIMNLIKHEEEVIAAVDELSESVVSITSRKLAADLRFGVVPIDGAGSGVDVAPEGPADTAGIRAGYLIVEVDGYEIRSVRDLLTRSAQMPPGREIVISFWRSGASYSTHVELAEAPAALRGRRRWRSRIAVLQD